MRQPRGYTLVELLVVFTMMFVILAAFLPTFVNTSKDMRLKMARAQAQAQARTTLANMARELQQAKAGTVVVDQETGQPPYSRITFERYRADGGVRTVSYYQKGEALFQSLNNQPAKVLFHGLAVLSFSYPRSDNDRLINVSVTVRSPTLNDRNAVFQLKSDNVRIMNP